MESIYSGKRAGFTLIELSIVLVIIGLIIGSVLVGTDLIRAAAVNAQISQFQQIKTAVTTFQTKYNCLPGDCANASTFFPGAVNGNGDGMVGTGVYPVSTLATAEEMNFFPQLGLSGMIPGQFSNVASKNAMPDNFMPNKIDRGGMLPHGQYGTGQSGLWLAVPGSVDLSSSVAYPVSAYANNFTPLEASAIDNKIDDGNPATGFVEASDWFWLSGHEDCLNDDNEDINSGYTRNSAKFNLVSCVVDFSYTTPLGASMF